MNYEEDIRIDGEALDKEWLNQPSLMMKYAKHAANKRKILEETKQNLDIAKAEADQKIRKHPERYKLEKTTDAIVANAILNEEGYKQAYSDYLDAKFESDMAQGAVNSFEQRKSALENLVRLYGQQYFAGPKMPLQIDRGWLNKEGNKKVSEKLNENTIQRRNK